MVCRITNRKPLKSSNKRNLENKRRERFGIKIPNTTREALVLDNENNDTKWVEAIAKEMAAPLLKCILLHNQALKGPPPHYSIQKIE